MVLAVRTIVIIMSYQNDTDISNAATIIKEYHLFDNI